MGQLPESLWELKETAKWARNSGEKKAAINALSARGKKALSSLEEVLAVTAYDDVRSECAEAIRSVKKKDSDEKEEGKPSFADLPS
ncbi:MAG TPA: hypothetical protein VF016_05055 [Nitrososphaera sp.]|jgi:hypothetical protein|nr:hypothetical protein [uncultured Nitrososphaera sp.]